VGGGRRKAREGSRGSKGKKDHSRREKGPRLTKKKNIGADKPVSWEESQKRRGKDERGVGHPVGVEGVHGRRR